MMTTTELHRFTCPLCGNMFDSPIVTSTNSFGPLHSDFFREAEGAQPICLFVHTCTNCGYTGFEGDFQPQTFSTEFRQLVAASITPEVQGRTIDTSGHYYLAALCAEWRGAPARELARIYHMGAWCCRIRGEKEKEKFYLGEAARYFEKALESGEIPPESRAMFAYVLGDIYRRLGDGEKARAWYGKVQALLQSHGGEHAIAEYAKRQLEGPRDIF